MFDFYFPSLVHWCFDHFEGCVISFTSMLSKTTQQLSMSVQLGGYRELSFIKEDVRIYITREVRNVLKLENAKEFGKYLLRMKETNQNFFFEPELEADLSIKITFWDNARSMVSCEYFRDAIAFDTTYNTNRNQNDYLMKYDVGDNKWLSSFSKIIIYIFQFISITTFEPA
ncbi:hypothetical protein Ahy_A04g018685 [Arachis hypogaea]|uniref:Protein FAR1-RELATED SEQUENCE n=1 Tax=Arachis hypogaea TaxID=3818 RepID=A0A445DE99_ARAHY|nr:hypothetical protein Ahy_A04g018685 [Arachis hypogaea]